MHDTIYIALCKDNTACMLTDDLWYQVKEDSMIMHGSDNFSKVTTVWAIYDTYISTSDAVLLSYILHKDVTQATFIQQLKQAIQDGVIGIATGILKETSQESIDKILRFANGEDK